MVQAGTIPPVEMGLVQGGVGAVVSVKVTVPDMGTTEPLGVVVMVAVKITVSLTSEVGEDETTPTCVAAALTTRLAGLETGLLEKLPSPL